MALVLTHRAGSEARLVAFLRTLPPAVQVVLLEPERPSALRPLLATLGRIPEPTLPADVHPTATVLVEAETGVRVLALVTPAEARRAGLSGLSRGGFLLVGDIAGLDAVWRDRGGVYHPVSPAVLRFLRRAPRTALRAFVRTSWLAARLPALGLPTTAPESLGVTVAGDTRQLQVSAILPRGAAGSSLPSRTVLTTPLAGAALLLDGVPASELFPRPLPPVLDALRQESGVRAELTEIARVLADQPLVIVVRSSPESVPEIVVGTRRDPERSDALVRALEALLERRLALASAQTDIVQVRGQRIRHQRPGRAARELRQATDGPWHTIEAPRAAGDRPLVVAESAHAVLVGTSRDAVLAVGSTVGTSPSSTAQRGTLLQAFVDGELFRRPPIIAHALQGLADDVRPWAEALRTLRLDVRSTRAALVVRGTAEFHLEAFPRTR